MRANTHKYVNLRVGDVITELNEAIEFVRERNATARFVLTVSPVPLVATMEDRSVLVSTTYSKSVLRVAAEEVAARYHQVAYFPSYEIITGNFTRGRYFSEGLRDVTEAGVVHVMRLFMKHYAADAENVSLPGKPAVDDGQSIDDRIHHELMEVVAVMCDEVGLDAESLETPLVQDRIGEPVPRSADAAENDSGGSAAWQYLRGAARTPPSQPMMAPPAGVIPSTQSSWRGKLTKLWRP
jgi:hypothetical protein